MDVKGSCFGLILLLGILLADASTIYVSDSRRSKVLEFYSTSLPCRVITDGNSISSVMTRNQVITIDGQKLNELATWCTNSNPNRKGTGLIFPGTKWCGPGNVAKDFNDLGRMADLDRCCRTHDHCPMTLEPGQCRHGVCNLSLFTRSHCDCDRKFKECLMEVNSDSSTLIGIIYFNIVPITCFNDRRECPPWMRNDLSYSWFCDEWKFERVDNFVPRTPENGTAFPNEIPEEPREKPLEPSKIDRNLHVMYQSDEDIERMMANPKTAHPMN